MNIQIKIKNGELKTKDIIIKNINFNLTSGSCFFLQAKNASGKTTLFKTIFKYKQNFLKENNIFTYDNFILIKDKLIYNIEDLNQNDLTEIGLFLTFQQPIVISELKTLDFLKIIYAVTHKLKDKNKLQKILMWEKFNILLKNFFKKYDLNLDLLNKGLNENFSGGEHKKISLLQAIIMNSSVMFLDEIDTGLDDISIKNIEDFIIKSLILNKAFFIISHNQNFIDNICKKIYKQNKKKINIKSAIFSIKNQRFYQIKTKYDKKNK